MTVGEFIEEMSANYPLDYELDISADHHEGGLVKRYRITPEMVEKYYGKDPKSGGEVKVVSICLLKGGQISGYSEFK